MQLKSWEVLRKYANRGITYNNLRYGRSKKPGTSGHLPCKMDVIECNGKRKIYYTYDEADIVKFINEYLRPKDGKRGPWKHIK